MWLSIRLPQLPLEALESDLEKQKPQAVIEDNRILCINQLAYEQGVKIGQTVTNAFAFCEVIQLYERKVIQEQQLLNNLAILIYPISSSIIIEPHGILIIEIARSLKLYKGVNSLIKTLTNILSVESINYQLAIGHSPTSAEILAFMPLSYSLTAVSNDSKVDINIIEKLLSQLSIESMLIDDKTISQFQSVGFKNISNLKQLPSASIQKRFGKSALNYLLKLFDQIPDPRDYFLPKENFHQQLEFNEVIHHRQGLLFPIKRLIKNLVRFLHLQQKNAQSLKWTLFDSSKNTLTFEVIFSNAQISAKNYLELTQLNLEHHQLKEPIEGISLSASELNPLQVESHELFEQASSFKTDTHFINKVKAKLGAKSCLQVSQSSSHLPEHASSSLSQVTSDLYPKPKAMLKLKQHSNKRQHNKNQRSFIEKKTEISALYTPTWLLDTPKPIRLVNSTLLLNGELTIISSPQKIASHWWLCNTVRDYYIAEHHDGSVCWVFFDQIKKCWFLHGIYG